MKGSSPMVVSLALMPLQGSLKDMLCPSWPTKCSLRAKKWAKMALGDEFESLRVNLEDHGGKPQVAFFWGPSWLTYDPSRLNKYPLWFENALRAKISSLKAIFEPLRAKKWSNLALRDVRASLRDKLANMGET